SPTCEAGLSPTRTAASPGVTPRPFRSAMAPASSARMAFATSVPSIRPALPGKIHRPCLPNDNHPDLPGILQLALDLSGDLLGELLRSGVVDRVGRHHHTHLAPRLDGEDLLDALELRRNLFELGEPLHVGLEGL